MKQMVKGLLEFNPYFRKSVKECLSFSIFDQMKTNHFNDVQFEKISLDVDKDDAYDYETGISKQFRTEDYL